jgi:hypothetical protein
VAGSSVTEKNAPRLYSVRSIPLNFRQCFCFLLKPFRDSLDILDSFKDGIWIGIFCWHSVREPAGPDTAQVIVSAILRTLHARCD